MMMRYLSIALLVPSFLKAVPSSEHQVDNPSFETRSVII